MGLTQAILVKLKGGCFPHPDLRKKEQYAKALCIKEGTDDWLTFCDLASISAGKIPADLLSDAALIGELPRFFRTARKVKI